MKNVLVTGATRGLGLAIAKRLVSDYHVIGIGRKATPEFAALGENARFVAYDLGELAGLHDLVKSITDRDGPLYALVNNAALGHAGVLATMHERSISELLRVNVESPILLSKYASRSMLLQREGRIVNVSSIVASTGFNALSVYGATKAALSGFTRSLARELGKAGITVNTVAPGYMETGMTEGMGEEQLDAIRRRSPSKKLVAPEDVANAVAYLLSAEAAMVNGSTITVDAGSTA